jgi:2-polyprenyl-6-methoxyphenol hydroxylase-like FAD-dependent oxidoreductase
VDHQGVLVIQGDLKTLQEAYAGFHPDVQAVIAACPEVHKWALFERDPLSTWVQGRVLLLGDACHPMTPYMAQGAAMALEDSVVLARCLDAHQGEISIPLLNSLRPCESLALQRFKELLAPINGCKIRPILTGFMATTLGVCRYNQTISGTLKR